MLKPFVIVRPNSNGHYIIKNFSSLRNKHLQTSIPYIAYGTCHCIICMNDEEQPRCISFQSISNAELEVYNCHLSLMDIGMKGEVKFKVRYILSIYILQKLLAGETGTFSDLLFVESAYQLNPPPHSFSQYFAERNLFPHAANPNNINIPSSKIQSLHLESTFHLRLFRNIAYI